MRQASIGGGGGHDILWKRVPFGDFDQHGKIRLDFENELFPIYVIFNETF